jgi:hypothetical protein
MEHKTWHVDMWHIDASHVDTWASVGGTYHYNSKSRTEGKKKQRMACQNNIKLLGAWNSSLIP